MRVLTPERARLLRLIKNRESWDPDRIRTYQEERLRGIIRYCWDYVPFYREHWQGHLAAPRDVRAIEDWARLPPVTRQLFREHAREFVTTKASVKSTEARSGGSTASPVIYRTTRHDDEFASAQLYNGWTWAGWRMGEPFLGVGGEPVGVGLGDKRNWREWGILEMVDAANQPFTTLHQPGYGLATSLTNLATPFVRYETGDRIHWHSFAPSPLGIAWPRIGQVEGRIGDVIHLSTGRSIPMPGLTLVMRWMEGLKHYQFIQTGPDAVTVRLDRGPDFTLTENDAKLFLRRRIAEEVNWTVEWGPPELTQSRKLLVIRNDWLRRQGLARPPQGALASGDAND